MTYFLQVGGYIPHGPTTAGGGRTREDIRLHDRCKQCSHEGKKLSQALPHSVVYYIIHPTLMAVVQAPYCYQGKAPCS